MSNRPFDLEKAKAGAPLITRDGRPAKFVAHVPEAEEDCRVIVLVGTNVLFHWENGPHYSRDGNSRHDLFMAPRNVVKWIGRHPDAADLHSKIFDTEAECREYYGKERFITRVEWEE